MSKSTVKLCGGCDPHPYQDFTYGHNYRVMNRGNAKKKGIDPWICTICGKKHEGEKPKEKNDAGTDSDRPNS